MPEWGTGPLGSIATVDMGQSPAGTDVNRAGDGVPLLNGPSEFRRRHPTPVQWTTKAPRLCCVGDVLFCVRGSTTGRMNQADQPYAIGRGLAAIRGSDEVESRFVQYAVEHALPGLLAGVTGSTFPNLSRTQLLDCPIYLPPASVRRAIARVLGALDDKIAANQRTVRLADELAEAVIRRAFSGETVAMVDVATVTMGSSPPGSSYNENAQGLPFYQGVRDFGVRFPSRRVWTDKPVRLAAARDTLLSVRAPVGRTNLAEEDICIGRGLAALRAKDGRAMTFFHQVRAAHAAWAPYEAEGTVFGAINRAQLEAIELPALSPSSAVDVETRLAALEALIASSLHETSALAATRDELLPLLMSGKVRVKDAEKLVEGVRHV